MAKQIDVAWRTPLMQANWRNWPVKQCGPRPTAEQVAAAAATGIKQHGTGKHMALAMYMRPQGATQAEVLLATGDTQVNAYRDAVTSGYVQPAVDGRGGHKAYALALPAKRKATRKPAGKAVKGKGAAKRKAVKPANTPKPAPVADNA